MVGVPRSQGCVRCIGRKIKCDMTRPQCRRCLSQGIACPGYDRGLKFQDQTQSLTRKYGRVSRSSMDEAFAPNLTLEALNVQTKVSFQHWLDDHFPSYAKSMDSRADVNWMDFIRTRWSFFPPALVWAFRALTSLHMGALHDDKEVIMCARHMYSRGIRHLACLLQSKAALSDETLAAAILLGGYEVLDGNTGYSWIIHSRGIRHLLCARGPAAHVHGVGRTLILSWQPFIVADAFINSEPCFLGDPEWARVSVRSESTEDQNQSGSLLVETMDRAFNEVARCPGYLAVTKEIVTSDRDADPVDLAALLDCILRSRQNLMYCRSKLEENRPPPSFIGEIPEATAPTLVQGSRGGVDSAIALLNQLTTMLQSHVNGRANALSGPASLNNRSDPWRIVAMRPAVGSASQSPDPAHLEPNPSTYVVGDQMDKFSLTMGMGSLAPDACGCPQFSAHKAIAF
ncbi:hypothetical protein ASPVEDRAFT_75104 [Aspergillus versicolor CBS 583.65]|uniref:Zn(2)-C6 fungal-type domain-containing protein n=1 Tax=Aspergillus versicolor CBS 583.65 TaxID=1036611 RepID=A0A1L9PWE4_ASPVE|nr:uncharacterized protein ASPVEDRAFT_75104 [Aspergillus versicolor CBS 583.65]OJJ05860.1 hypothetical protein ASPVEDRAFT_75104 [Aspergillus versicolor CBS 583.65]